MEAKRQHEGRVTLRDVAREAKVSVSTASRVLSAAQAGESRRETESAIRVRRAAARLDYQPDHLAASLRSKRTRMIGVIVPHLTDIVLATIYEGIDARATQEGYQTVVANSFDDPRQQKDRVLQLIQRGMDGLVLGDAHLDNTFLGSLRRRGVEFVLVSRRCGSHPSVTCDDLAGGAMAGNHVADLGHRAIAVLAGQPFASTGVDRTTGFREALAARGIQLNPDAVVNCPFTSRGGHEAMLHILDSGIVPSAVFAVNDITAIGAMGALRDRGLRVGHDVAVVGYNDISIAPELPTPLTTIRSPLREMGARAAEALLTRLKSRVEQRASEQIRLAPQLVVRASSDSSIDASFSRSL